MKYSGQGPRSGRIIFILSPRCSLLLQCHWIRKCFFADVFSGHYRWLSGGTPRGYGCWLHLTIDFYEKFSKEGG